ncbi:MAG: sulfatase-like hydrolase/transferase [Mediterranea sp.]|jgi:phosphoglycerol transferase MdoB-like AlkP superfamily enzyme|nr:sulfatase-like hydrolase/transferase [Mediterranea sp.]
MSVQRLILLAANWRQINDVETKFGWISSALLRGIWFDNVIACYITILPLVILSFTGLLNFASRRLLPVFNVYYIILYLPVFAIGIADIPYFHYFFKHLNVSIFNWSEEGGTAAQMILEETSYYVYMILFLIIVSLFGYLVFMISRKFMKEQPQNLTLKQYIVYLPACFVLTGLCLFGIRGRTGYNPIKTSQAYFCNNPFLNQLGINPSFYLMRDIIESSKKHYTVNHIIPEKEAIAIAREALGADSLPASGDYPVVRNVVAHGMPEKMNVVIILMESMSADLLKIKENGKEITPFLNELIDRSYYFGNFYSAGTHTNHGIMATLYGMPALFGRNMMKNVDIPLCEGLPDVLQRYNYRTMFFMTHEAQYDNMNAFLTENGIEEIYSEEDYPRDKCKNSFGVADDFLFEYGLNKINEKAKEPGPFLATLLTVSNHPPYIVPGKFKAVSDEAQYQIVAFADDAIRQFMENARKEEWYQNTIFALLGDHGKVVGSQTYEMPLSYNHVPFIIYSPAFEDAPRRFECLGGQVDVFPTLMGLLNYSYQNNTFGVDLFKTVRPYIFFSSDDALGCIDHDYFYMYNFKTGIEGLYKYNENKPDNLISHHVMLGKNMLTYSAAMTQTADYMLRNRLIRIRRP